MKKLLFIFAVVLFTAGFASKVSAQVTKSNNAGGEILAPITLTKGLDLEFGKLAVLAGGGTVTLTPDASTTVSKTADVTLVSGVTPTAGSFTVGGTKGYSYSIAAPSSILITITGGGSETMTVAPVTIKSKSDVLSTSGTLDGTTGTDIIYVGGTLTIAAGQVAGRYSGPFEVTVNYN